MNRDTIVLEKMLEEIRILEESTKGINLNTFMLSEDKKRAAAMTLINIGELVRHLTKDFKKSAIDMPFDDIVGLRNIAAHGYKSLSFDMIWNTITNDIPDLKHKIKKLLPQTKP